MDNLERVFTTPADGDDPDLDDEDPDELIPDVRNAAVPLHPDDPQPKEEDEE